MYIYIGVEFIFNYLIKIVEGADKKIHIDNIWRDLDEHIGESIQQNILDNDQLIAGIHALTLPSPIKTYNEKGPNAFIKINEHFFYYGKRGDKSFDLLRKYEKKTSIRRP